MYKGHSIWDQEQDKDKTPIGDSPEDKYKGKEDYQSGADYNSGGKPGDDYNSKKAEEEKKNKEKSEFEKQVDDNMPKEKYKKEESEEETVRKTAAKEINQGIQEEKTKIDKKSKSSKSIEDAIKKAIKDEKEVIRL